MNEQKLDYVNGVCRPHLIELGMSEKCANATIKFMIKRAQVDAKTEDLKKSHLATVGAGAGLGGVTALIKTLLSKGQGEGVGEFMKDLIINSLTYGGLGAGLGGGMSALFPRLGENIGKGVREIF